jgi:hypothetical protein
VLNFCWRFVFRFLKFEELGELAKHLVVDTVRVFLQNLQTAIGYLKDAPLWRGEQGRLFHVRSRPADAIVEDKLTAAGQQFAFFRVR